jgi:hypothetical protein
MNFENKIRISDRNKQLSQAKFIDEIDHIRLPFLYRPITKPVGTTRLAFSKKKVAVLKRPIV